MKIRFIAPSRWPLQYVVVDTLMNFLSECFRIIFSVRGRAKTTFETINFRLKGLATKSRCELRGFRQPAKLSLSPPKTEEIYFSK